MEIRTCAPPLAKRVSSKKIGFDYWLIYWFDYGLFFHYLLVFRLSFLKSFSGIQVQTVTGSADPSLRKQLFTAPSLIEHRQLQLDCKGRACAPPSLHFFIFLSVCLKNQGKNNLHGRGLTISAIIRMLSATPPPPPQQPGEKLPPVCACLCWLFSSSKSNLFLHSGRAPLLLSACQAPSGGWQASCQQRPSRPVKGTRVSLFPWSRWRCQPDISLTRHP